MWTGFFDLTLSKSAIKLDLVNHLGNVVLSHSIPPFSGHVGLLIWCCAVPCRVS